MVKQNKKSRDEQLLKKWLLSHSSKNNLIKDMIADIAYMECKFQEVLGAHKEEEGIPQNTNEN